jgi:hypothetical protein
MSNNGRGGNKSRKDCLCGYVLKRGNCTNPNKRNCKKRKEGK